MPHIDEQEVDRLVQHLATCGEELCARIRERLSGARRIGTHQHWPDWACEMYHELEARINQLEMSMTANQEELDADVKALGAGMDALEAEIASLKAQAGAAAAPLDFSGLDAVVARLKGDEPTPPADSAPEPTEAPPADSAPTEAPPATS